MPIHCENDDNNQTIPATTTRIIIHTQRYTTCPIYKKKETHTR